MHTRLFSRPNWQRPSKNLPCPALEPKTRTELMADAMIAQDAEGGCTRQTLLDDDFTEVELETLAPAAKKLAKARTVRETALADTRPLRLAQARLAIAEILPSRQYIVAELQGRLFATSEIDDLLDEAITLAADDFAALGMGTVQ